MERVVHKATSHTEARRWDVEQQRRMTPQERQRAARQLKARAYPADAKDVREWHPVEVDAAHFSPDTRNFLRLLARHGVRYLIVGGEAVIFHGHVRLTGDVDFFFANDAENTTRMFRALQEFWEGDVPGIAGPGELTAEGLIVQFGQPPNRIDLLSAIDGVTFAEAWATRVETVLVGSDAETPIPYVGLDVLVRNKRAAGRPKDLDNLTYLTGGP